MTLLENLLHSFNMVSDSPCSEIGFQIRYNFVIAHSGSMGAINPL